MQAHQKFPSVEISLTINDRRKYVRTHSYLRYCNRNFIERRICFYTCILILKIGFIQSDIVNPLFRGGKLVCVPRVYQICEEFPGLRERGIEKCGAECL